MQNLKTNNSPNANIYEDELREADTEGHGGEFKEAIDKIMENQKIADAAKTSLDKIAKPKSKMTRLEGAKAMEDAGYSETEARAALGINEPEYEKSFAGAWKAIKMGKVISRISERIWGDKMKLTKDQLTSLEVNLKAREQVAKAAVIRQKRIAQLAEKVENSGKGGDETLEAPTASGGVTENTEKAPVVHPKGSSGTDPTTDVHPIDRDGEYTHGVEPVDEPEPVEPDENI
jgi:hypothetical protein